MSAAEHAAAAKEIIDAMKKAGLVPAGGVANSLDLGGIRFRLNQKGEMVILMDLNGEPEILSVTLDKSHAVRIAAFLLPWSVSP